MNRHTSPGRLSGRIGRVGSRVAAGLVLGSAAVPYAWAADPYSALREAIVKLPSPLTSDGFFALRIWPVIPAFAGLLGVVVLLLLTHYLVFGPKDLRGKAADDQIVWWRLVDRIVHGLVAVGFLAMACTGLAMSFGRWVPTFGLGYALRVTHELVAFAFTPVLVVMLLRMARFAPFRRGDGEWLAHAGGYLGYQGPLRAGKFNAGQKLWYWVVVASGAVLAGTGFALYFGWGSLAWVRLWVFVHFVAMAPIVAFFLVHLYLSTVANRGVWRSMWWGRVPRSAAQAFHPEASELERQWPRAA